MIEKELKRMSRSELLELLLDQAEENRILKEELDKFREKLDQKQIAIENAGSIAEASLQLNGIFESAQNAIQQYVDNVKQQWSQQEEMCNRLIEEAKRKADAIIAEAEEYSLRIRAGEQTALDKESDDMNKNNQ